MQKDYRFKSYQDDIDDRITGKIFYSFVAIFFAIYLIVIIGSYSFYSRFEYISVSGASMQNTINPDVDLLADNEEDKIHDAVIIRRTHDVDYGDIIILDRPDEEGARSIIKRALGFEGDCVTIVKINGQYRLLRVKNNTQKVEILYENYVKSYEEWSRSRGGITVDGVSYEKTFYDHYNGIYQKAYFTVNGVSENVLFYKVPEDQIFFMGDNRAHSSDARELGTYEVNRIEGKVVVIVKDAAPKKSQYWWINRVLGYLKVVWSDILTFFGAKS